MRSAFAAPNLAHDCDFEPRVHNIQLALTNTTALKKPLHSVLFWQHNHYIDASQLPRTRSNGRARAFIVGRGLAAPHFFFDVTDQLPFGSQHLCVVTALLSAPSMFCSARFSELASCITRAS